MHQRLNAHIMIMVQDSISQIMIKMATEGTITTTIVEATDTGMVIMTSVDEIRSSKTNVTTLMKDSTIGPITQIRATMVEDLTKDANSITTTPVVETLEGTSQETHKVTISSTK